MTGDTELKRLIELGDCDGNCTDKFKDKKLRCCFEKRCFKFYKLYDKEEFNKRFNEEEKQLILGLLNKDGFTSDKGCRLLRELRPLHCLKWNCRRT